MKDDIIEMAREAGPLISTPFDVWCERFAALVRADERDRATRENAYVLAEREACALVCINIANKPSNVILGVAIDCAAAIRARGQA
jgi:hypothetical protein